MHVRVATQDLLREYVEVGYSMIRIYMILDIHNAFIGDYLKIEYFHREI